MSHAIVLDFICWCCKFVMNRLIKVSGEWVIRVGVLITFEHLLLISNVFRCFAGGGSVHLLLRDGLCRFLQGRCFNKWQKRNCNRCKSESGHLSNRIIRDVETWIHNYIPERLKVIEDAIGTYVISNGPKIEVVALSRIVCGSINLGLRGDYPWTLLETRRRGLDCKLQRHAK